MVTAELAVGNMANLAPLHCDRCFYSVAFAPLIVGRSIVLVMRRESLVGRYKTAKLDFGALLSAGPLEWEGIF